MSAARVSNAQLATLGKGRNKYGAVRTQCGHRHRHASKKEAARCDELHMLEAAGDIHELKQQPRFPLECDDTRICVYVADFQYAEYDHRAEYWRLVVEDVKSKATMTPVCKLKLRLMKALRGIEVRLT